jgi:hypothetical protein
MLLTSDSPLEMCALDAEHVAAVLEDCVDQLAVLGSIISVPDNPTDAETVGFCEEFDKFECFFQRIIKLGSYLSSNTLQRVYLFWYQLPLHEITEFNSSQLKSS